MNIMIAMLTKKNILLYIFTTLLSLASITLATEIVKKQIRLLDLPHEIFAYEILIKQLVEQGSFKSALHILTLKRVNKKIQNILDQKEIKEKIQNTLLTKKPEIKNLLSKITIPEKATQILFESALLNKYSLFLHTDSETTDTQELTAINKFVISMLLQQGAKINHSYQETITLEISGFKTQLKNVTPLFCAVACNLTPDLIRALLAHGAHPDAANNKGQTVLMIARLRGLYGVIKSLLKYGADSNKKDKDDGKTVFDEKYGKYPWSIKQNTVKKIIDEISTVKRKKV